jgi:hypothetical protein
LFAARASKGQSRAAAAEARRTLGAKRERKRTVISLMYLT